MGECLLYGNGGGDGCTIRFKNYKPLGTEAEYHWTWDPLSVARAELAATTVGSKALFGGGTGDRRDFPDTLGYVGTVDAYTETGIHTVFPKLSKERYSLAATSVGDKALFGGGCYNSSLNNVDSYTEAGAHAVFPNLSKERYALAATSVGNKALFGGGYNSDTWVYHSSIDAYTEAGVLTAFTALSVAREKLVATTVGSKALFGGGSYREETADGGVNTIRIDAVDAFTAAGARTAFSPLSQPDDSLCAVTIGSKALFGHRTAKSSGCYAMDAYTEAGVYTAFPKASDLYNVVATSVGSIALFGGGYGSTIITYTETGVRSALPKLSLSRRDLAATSVGDKAIFGGGMGSGYPDAIVDVYSDPATVGIEPTVSIRIMPSGVYNFGDGEQTVPGNIIDADSTPITVDVLRPVNGYIKYKGAKFNG